MKPNSTKGQRALHLLGLAGNIWKSEMGRVLNGVINTDDGKELLKTRINQASELVKTLGNLKGAAMKFGQILALEARDLFPDEVVHILERLQSSASPLPFLTIQSILQAELGPRFSDLQDLSPEPIAAASIGQVHTARINGRKVAIKIQYPNIEESLESDIKIFHYVAKAASLMTGKSEIDYTPMLQELTDVFKQEIDYRQEAINLQKFRKLAAASNQPWIKIPELFSDHSTQRVLTLSFEEGVTLSDAVRSRILTRAERDFYADCFLSLYTTEFCQWGLVQTDPNLGNFLLQPAEQKMVLLDFGATRTYTPEFRRTYSKLILSAYREDRSECLELCFELGLLDRREQAPARDALVELVVRGMEPFREESYSFIDEVYSTQMRDLSRQLIQKLQYSPPPHPILFLHRKLGGIFQMLKRLEVTKDLRPFIESFRALSNDQAS